MKVFTTAAQTSQDVAKATFMRSGGDVLLRFATEDDESTLVRMSAYEAEILASWVLRK